MAKMVGILPVFMLGQEWMINEANCGEYKERKQFDEARLEGQSMGKLREAKWRF